jgi:hypothetical protein
MYVSKNGARIVGRRFRRAAWIVGFIVLAVLVYVGAYVEAMLAGIGLWGVFQLAARAVERAGGVGIG